ncbi:Rha family transcriptional regulator [Desulfovibrio desulfuricans]|uniref:Rha family transcriptional regulator n=1 Tax=Desulfovibrio desulfuricans TaxID=876 RepID=UPI00398456F7
MANTIISANAPELNVIDGMPLVSSLALADHFDKPHNRVLDSIREICGDLPEDIRSSDFRLSQYDGKTPNGGKRTYPMYLLTRDGFTLVAMGFTGKKALAWKVKYIQAFNAMEMELAKMTAPKRKSKALGRGIKALPESKPAHVFKRMGLTPLEELQMGSHIKRMFDGLDMEKIGPRTMEALVLKAKYVSAVSEIYSLNRDLVRELGALMHDVNGPAMKALNETHCFSDPVADTLYEPRYRLDRINEDYRAAALAALNNNICMAMMLGV